MESRFVPASPIYLQVLIHDRESVINLMAQIALNYVKK